MAEGGSDDLDGSTSGGWGNLFFMTTLFTMVIGVALYLTRQRWMPAFQHLVHRSRSSLNYSFLADQEAGLSSNSFNLAGNIRGGDSRAGLDDRAKAEIKRIMQRDNVTFDEARRVYTQGQFADNGIGPDGRPLDPKAFFFS